LISEEIKTLVREHFPDFPIDEADRLPLGIYEWLVINIWAPTRANWTDEQILADFMNNEGRMGEFRYDG
jgi:hypothetical protein